MAGVRYEVQWCENRIGWIIVRLVGNSAIGEIVDGPFLTEQRAKQQLKMLETT